MENLNKMKIAMVSKSPSRRDLMELMGFEKILICDSGFEEDLEKANFTNKEYVAETCRGKFNCFRERQLTDRIAIAFFFDTIIVNPHGDIYEKPADEKEHFEMIKVLSGATHLVYTAMIISYNPKLLAEGLGLNPDNYEGI